MSQEVIDEHYQRIAERYSDYLSYSGDFVTALVTKMIDMLRLSEDDVFVDVGGGTGIYTAAILEQLQLREPVVLVDFSADMLDHVPEDLPVEKVHMDALTFSEQPRRYDKVLIKETVHHVDDRRALFQNLYERLQPGGALLLVHVPPDLDYPLFEAAKKRAMRWHADPDELERLLGEVGLRVERDAVDWAHSMPKQRYFDMVASQYMSVLSSFSEEEIAEGLREMDETYAEVEVLEFTDHFDYIVGYKS
ncbi:MAG TPA: methyltransferase domain-containing protein [Acidimicrobiales bacterium]|nr:methyltransferase domain-containing protein [Acidimicrobiales bacterium]